MPSEGNPNAEVMVIGQSPGRQEVEELRPFIGPSGELVDLFLAEAGFLRSEVYIANALKCRPVNNRTAYPEELFNCKRVWLRKEIQAVKPRVIVLFGKDAFKSVLTKREWSGHLSTHTGKSGIVYLCVYHPAYFLRQGKTDEFIKCGQVLRETLDAVDM